MQIMHDRVMLKKIEPPKQSSTGLYIPYADESVKATVIKTGAGRLTPEGVRIAPTVVEGDVVLYNVGAAIAVTLNKEEYLVVKESDILLVVDKE